MKKCLIMFALLLTTLIVAVVTEKKQKIAVADDLALGEKLNEDIAFGQTRPDQNRNTDDK